MKIHFHTDCYWFSGSETTLTVLWQRLRRDSNFQASFTYVPWPEYESGLRRALVALDQTRALKLLDPEGMKAAVVRGRSGPIEAAVKAVARALPLRQVSLGSSIRRLTQMFAEEAPDIVHINNGGFPGAISCNAAAIAARRAGIPAVVYVVNNMSFGYRRMSRIADYPTDRAVVRAVSTFVTGSEAAGHALARVLKVPPGRRTVIPNSIAPGSADETPEATRRRLGLPGGLAVVSVIARLEHRKGHRYLLEACHQLERTTGITPILLIAGVGPLATTLARQAQSLGISAQVRFLGQQANVWDLLQVSDVLALPSIDHEDFPIVILEAMAAGVPVVATRIAGIPEQVVPDATGLLVRPGDRDALASAIGRVLSDQKWRVAMGRAGRERFNEYFAPEIAAARYKAMYRELLGIGPRPVDGRAA